MAKCRFVALGGMSLFAASVALMPAPAVAQSDLTNAATYGAGVDLGRTLQDPRQCTGSGEYHDGCVDGVTESRFDREADQALGSDLGEAKPAQSAPLLSPPPDLFQQPFSKPDDGQSPNN